MGMLEEVFDKKLFFRIFPFWFTKELLEKKQN